MLVKGFIKLLQRYQNGSLPEHLKGLLDIWYNAIQKDPVKNRSKWETQERIWEKISSGIGSAKEERTIPKIKYPWFSVMVRVAAVLTIVFGGMLYIGRGSLFNILEERQGQVLPNENWNMEINHNQTVKRIKLSDGSIVMLEPGSKLTFPKSFEPDFRKVHLDGDGFFSVQKDSNRPFLVYSGAVITRVLGTSFSVKAISATGGTEVAVITGKVVVEKATYGADPGTGKPENRVVLTPNKKVTFFKDSEHYVTGLVENPVILHDQVAYLKPHAFNFDETPVKEILDKLEKAYGIEITLSNDNMLECPITADLSSDNLYEKMEIISAILNARYEVTGASVLITGSGCETHQVKPNP